MLTHLGELNLANARFAHHGIPIIYNPYLAFGRIVVPFHIIISMNEGGMASITHVSVRIDNWEVDAEYLSYRHVNPASQMVLDGCFDFPMPERGGECHVSFFVQRPDGPLTEFAEAFSIGPELLTLYHKAQPAPYPCAVALGSLIFSIERILLDRQRLFSPYAVLFGAWTLPEGRVMYWNGTCNLKTDGVNCRNINRLGKVRCSPSGDLIEGRSPSIRGTGWAFALPRRRSGRWRIEVSGGEVDIYLPCILSVPLNSAPGRPIGEVLGNVVFLHKISIFTDYIDVVAGITSAEPRVWYRSALVGAVSDDLGNIYPCARLENLPSEDGLFGYRLPRKANEASLINISDFYWSARFAKPIALELPDLA